MEELRTERLRLRAWTTSPGDLARMADLYGREEIQRWVGGTPTVTPAVLVERWATVHRLDERYGCWAIEPPDGPVAGTVLFKPLPNGVGEVEVGWHLHPDSWGHGYATEAARAVIARGFAAGVPVSIAKRAAPVFSSLTSKARLIVASGKTPISSPSLSARSASS